MEIGAFFILMIVLIVLAVLGGGVYTVATWLRHKQLHPEEEEIEGPREFERQRPPEHHKVETEQGTRFVGTP